MDEKLKTIIYVVIFIILLIVVTLIFNMRSTQTHNQNKGNIDINSKIIQVNDENFEEEVLKSNKTVLIDFYATWCGPCKMMEPIIKEIANENENLKVVEVDVDTCKKITNKYKIRAMPTFVVIRNGSEINRSVGAIPKDKVLELCGI